MKDCISRYQIADVATFKKMLFYSISNIGSVFSYKSLGAAVGTNENTANGIINAVSYRFWDNKAKLFENFIFNELQKQQFEEITFANNDGECDFVAKKGIEYQAIQACYELTPENNKREIDGFTTIENSVNASKKTIITYNQEMQIGNVTVVPAWKYFWEEK